ncbi:hypothetical protein IC607_08160 [Cellulomonas sp. JH27-2]|uniref:HGxxPAAW family protein n=1 Tax=Cellulomonas sp. JH27-2 TaxID=2774139 RepID=UPI001781DDBC|nr:HGxxPAAW family protein [Cellulomonas sp. JH27-2]MBD8058940.1 hypothetical protein [Cellulomonas sp. JH27-2]
MADNTLAHRAQNATTTETMQLPPSAPPVNHGKTQAAWVTCWLIVIGGTVAGLGVAFAWVWMFWAGLGICVLGLVIGGVMKSMGFGQGGAATIAREKTHGGH